MCVREGARVRWAVEKTSWRSMGSELKRGRDLQRQSGERAF